MDLFVIRPHDNHFKKFFAFTTFKLENWHAHSLKITGSGKVQIDPGQFYNHVLIDSGALFCQVDAVWSNSLAWAKVASVISAPPIIRAISSTRSASLARGTMAVAVRPAATSLKILY